MIRDALKKLAGDDNRQQVTYSGGGPAQDMIEEGKRRDHKYGYMYGDYYEKRARKKAAKIYGPGGGYRNNYTTAPVNYGPPPSSYGRPPPGYGGYSSAPTPAQQMIEEGRRKDKKIGGMYGDYYEKKARKKAKKMYGGY